MAALGRKRMAARLSIPRAQVPHFTARRKRQPSRLHVHAPASISVSPNPAQPRRRDRQDPPHPLQIAHIGRRLHRPGRGRADLHLCRHRRRAGNGRALSSVHHLQQERAADACFQRWHVASGRWSCRSDRLARPTRLLQPPLPLPGAGGLRSSLALPCRMMWVTHSPATANAQCRPRRQWRGRPGPPRPKQKPA